MWYHQSIGTEKYCAEKCSFISQGLAYILIRSERRKKMNYRLLVKNQKNLLIAEVKSVYFLYMETC